MPTNKQIAEKAVKSGTNGSRGFNIFQLIVIGSGKTLVYYVMLIVGALLVIFAVFAFISIYGDRNYPLFVGSIGIFLVGILLLTVSLLSLKYVLLKEYDVVSGKCVIEIDSSGRSSLADFNMLHTGEMFTFIDIPALDAYGKSIPYYCEVTVTKDHMFEIGYKIYDAKTRKLILTSE